MKSAVFIGLYCTFNQSPSYLNRRGTFSPKSLRMCIEGLLWIKRQVLSIAEHTLMLLF